MIPQLPLLNFQPPTHVLQVKPIENEKPSYTLLEKKYAVVEGDNLTKIAENNGSSWLRLWQKNTDITDPDLIHTGQSLIIPLPDEVLPDRPLPEKIAPVETQFRDATKQPRGASSGNTYEYGYCTWYVKNKRPDLPNNLGNAETWTVRAAEQGIGTGSTPVAGAVGQKANHVVYVESVNGSQMTVSEMNFQGWNIVSSRTISSAGWNFIY